MTFSSPFFQMKTLLISDYTNTAGSTALRHIHSARPHETIIFFLCDLRYRNSDGRQFRRRDHHLSGKKRPGFHAFSRSDQHLHCDTDFPWEYTWVEFDGLRAKEIVETAGLSPDHPVYHSHSADLRQKMMEEMLYISHNSQESPFHLIGHTWLFLDYFMRSTETVRMKQDGSIRDFYIKEALSFIEQNFQNDISIEDIAACCGLNRSYFGKIFHDTIGRSPQEFLISYRMTKAAELLKITALSIADIGNAVGYPNQLHFPGLSKMYTECRQETGG